MPIQYHLLSQDEVIFGFGHGIVTSREIIEGLAQLSEEPGFRDGLDRIVCFDNSASLSDLDFESFKQIKNTSRKGELSVRTGEGRKGTIEYKLAIVCSATLRDTVFKLYQAVWDAEESAKVDVKTFLQKQDALNWLGYPNLKTPDSRTATRDANFGA